VVLNGGAIQKREEVEQQIVAFPGNGHRVPKGEIAQKLGAVRRKKLHELFQVRNHRSLFNVRTGQDALIEVAIDRATITATAPPKKPARGHLEFQELEIELKEGAEEVLQEVAETIRERCGLLPSRLSKFERGLQAVGLCPPAAQMREEARLLEEADFVRDLRARPLKTRDPVIKLAYRYLLEQFEEVLCQEPRAWEGLDPEGVHQMRVATRRIRAALRAFKDVLPATPRKAFNREFKRVAAVLGEVRDLDVYQEQLQHYAAEIPEEDRDCLIDYQQHLAEQWRQSRKGLLKCLNGEWYERLKERFAEFLRSGPSQSAIRTVGSLTIGDAARKIIGKQHKKVLRDGRAIAPDSPDEALHALRIDCKGLRYLFEFFHPVYGKSLDGFIRRLKDLQDVLGEFQDACVATQRLRAYADQIPMGAENRGQLLAIGQLIHSQRAEAADRRAGFHRVWKRFDRRGGRNRTAALLKRA
jgi:CHAD domain-containing protein